MKDRTITTVAAIGSLTILAGTALAVQRDVVVLAPTISAILVLMGHEASQRMSDHKKNK